MKDTFLAVARYHSFANCTSVRHACNVERQWQDYSESAIWLSPSNCPLDKPSEPHAGLPGTMVPNVITIMATPEPP
ncbi:unnamed protein product [Lasius platythorax]|uniref:Uncharacterized protein n=1 Tax=Lasius platythorax TaxID=488582 RepID=A0AAV2P2W4_9HYME